MNKFIEQQYEVYKAKNILYGDSFKLSLDKWGYLAFAIRIEDKLNRIRQLLSDKDFSNELAIVSDESVSDTIRDLFNYTAMFMSYTEEIEVLESMNIIHDNILEMKSILFESFPKYDEIECSEIYVHLLNHRKKEDVVLFDNIRDLLNVMWNN